MGFFSSINDFFSVNTDSVSVAEPDIMSVGNSYPEDTHTETFCTASGTEPAWHNGFGVENDFTTIDTFQSACDFGNDW